MDKGQTVDPQQLSLTPRGTTWIEQFDPADRKLAKELLSALTLVSHNEFERSLTRLIVNEAKAVKGPVALYATREFDPAQPYFESKTLPVNAVGEGNDLGSEARVAALIRNLSRSNPKTFLNHPTIEEMRIARCRGLFLIDDFIGSGERTSEFLSAIWLNSTIRSWSSLHLLSIRAVTYAATDVGTHRVSNARGSPDIAVERDCPTFWDMPWSKVYRQKAFALIDKYGVRTSCSAFSRGFDWTAAAIVFEHGCPDNCPAIFWAPPSKSSSWEPMFPGRSVLPSDASAFPPEITRPDADLILLRAGQRHLAVSGAISISNPIGPALLMAIALIAKGLRSRAAISHATGLSARQCTRLLDRCVECGLVTPKLRLTPTGLAELAHARHFMPDLKDIPSLGSDSYYPQQLRGPSGPGAH